MRPRGHAARGAQGRRHVPWPFAWTARGLLYGTMLFVAVALVVTFTGRMLLAGKPDECASRAGACLDPDTALLRPERIQGRDGKARPMIPCRFIGTWTSQRGDQKFVINLRDDGIYMIQPHLRGDPQGDYGFWAVQGSHMIWRHDRKVTGPDYNPITQETPGHFVLGEMRGNETVFDRVRPAESSTCVP
jgi:hypothetical protein